MGRYNRTWILICSLTACGTLIFPPANAQAQFPVITPVDDARPSVNLSAKPAPVPSFTFPAYPNKKPIPQSQPMPVPLRQPQSVNRQPTYRVDSWVPAAKQQAHYTNPFTYSPAPKTYRGKMVPSASQEHLNQALRFESQNNTRMAIHSYHRALEADPTNRVALVSFARMKHRIGDLDGAIVTYRQSLKLHPNDPIALNDLGLCYARNDETKSSLQCLTAASRLRPENKRYSNNLATVLVESQKIEQAIIVLDEAYGPAIAQYNVALMLHQRNDRTRARFHAQKALELDPSLTPARDLITMLGGPENRPEDRTEKGIASAENAGSDSEASLGEIAPEPSTAMASAESNSHADAEVERAHWNFMKRPIRQPAGN